MMEPASIDDAQPIENRALPIRSHAIQVSGALRPYVTGLIAAELGPVGPLPLSIVPQESMMLTVQLGAAADCIEQKGAHGENTSLTGIRRHTGRFVGAGDCVTLFALLTPLGGNVLPKHVDLLPRLQPQHFERWLALWTRHTAQQIAPHDAAELQATAAGIARNLHLGCFGHVPDFAVHHPVTR